MYQGFARRPVIYTEVRTTKPNHFCQCTHAPRRRHRADIQFAFLQHSQAPRKSGNADERQWQISLHAGDVVVEIGGRQNSSPPPNLRLPFLPSSVCARPQSARSSSRMKSSSAAKSALRAYMQNRVPNSQRYLVNAKPGTNHSTNPTNPNGNSKW